MKKKILITIGVLLVLALVVATVILLVPKPDINPYETFTVKRGDISQDISVSGKLEVPSSVQYSFKASGRLTELSVQVGDYVAKGDILARQDTANLEAELNELEHNINIQRASLDQLLSGASDEEVRVREVSLSQAKIDYENAEKDLERTRLVVEENKRQAKKNYDDIVSDDPSNVTNYEQAVTSAEINLSNTKNTYSLSLSNQINSIPTFVLEKNSLVRIALDDIFIILDDDDSENLLGAKDTALLALMNTSYKNSLELLQSSETNYYNYGSDDSYDNMILIMDDLVDLAKSVSDTLSISFKVLEASITGNDFSQADLDLYKTTISLQSSTINSLLNTAVSKKQSLLEAKNKYDTNTIAAEESLQSAKTSLSEAIISLKNISDLAILNGNQQILIAEAKVSQTKEAYELANAQLEQIKAPARSTDVNLYNAQINQAIAKKQKIETQLDDMLIVASASGTVAIAEGELGEILSPGAVVIELLPDNILQIELDISENNIIDVALGQKARILLDAFGGALEWAGEVVKIDPAETVIGGAVYYKATIELGKLDERVKPGMSADVWIQTSRSVDVLYAPASAIKLSEGKSVVEIFEKPKKVIEKEVEIGIKNFEGMVEIVSGVSEGEEIIIGKKN